MSLPNSSGLAVTLRPGSSVTGSSVTFEWIDVEDKDARRKARSHVIRESKHRQKTEALRNQKLKEGNKRQLAPAEVKIKSSQQASPQNETSIVASQQGTPREEMNIVAVNAHDYLPSVRNVLQGLIDPFNQMPAESMSSQDLGLVDHYYTAFRPKPFLLSNCDYTPVKNLMLQVTMQDPASFLILMSVSATDIALRLEKPDSLQSIKYRSQAMTMVNTRMTSSQLSFTDGTINACCMLAGLELLFGTPKTFNTHMDGIVQMLKLRGGYEKVQQSNPPLASLLAWHDFAGAAALASERRFSFTSCDPLTSASPKPLEFTAPFNVPRDILPPNYTLYDDLMILIDNLENATTLIRLKSMEKSKLQQHTDFIAKLNSDLIRILSPPSKKTIPFRRFLIEDSFRITCLIYISAICKSYDDWDMQSNATIEKLRITLLNNSQNWAYTIEMLLRFLISGGKAESQKTVHCVEQLMKLFVPLDWSQWQNIRDVLLDYFLSSDLCLGPLQDLWQCRINL